MNNIESKYLLVAPKSLLDKIRLLSAQRKMQNHANRTQRAILIELLEKGLFFANDELPTNEPQTL